MLEWDGGGDGVTGLSVTEKAGSPIILSGKQVKKPKMAEPSQMETIKSFCLVVGPSSSVLKHYKFGTGEAIP